LIALYVRDEYSYDRFFPAHERIYKVDEIVQIPGRPAISGSQTASNVARALQLDFGAIDMTARLLRTVVVLGSGERESTVNAAGWVDADFFRLFQMKALAGDPVQALRQPDGLVLTRSVAMRIFGRIDVIGEALELNHEHTQHVTAVVEDLPPNTHLDVQAFLPAVAAYSEISRQDAVVPGPGSIRSFVVYTYARVKPGTDVGRINADMPGFVQRHIGGDLGGVSVSKAVKMWLAPMTGAHLGERQIDAMKPQGDVHTLRALSAIALLILIVAVSNFVSMMTARGFSRSVEIGVRKAVGAKRSQIAAQFAAECIFYVAVAVGIALLATGLVLPAFNAFLQRSIALDPFHDPLVGTLALFAIVTIGLAASAYPAFALSSLPPGSVLRGTGLRAGGSGGFRRFLVVIQFAILVGLVIVTLTVDQQTEYALQNRLKLPGDLIYLTFGGCPRPFAEAVRQLPGVQKVSCVSSVAVAQSHWGAVFTSPGGEAVSVESAPVDYTYFDLFGIKPLAGRTFATDRGEDNVLVTPNGVARNPSIVINESAARVLGFHSPQEAIGAFRSWGRPRVNQNGFGQTPPMSSQIVGVIPDFSLGSVRDAVGPTIYYIDPPMSSFGLVVRLTGDGIPRTLNAMRALWKQQGRNGAFEGQFLNQYLDDLYTDITRQSRILTAFSFIAVVLAGLGLLGMAAHTAQRCTREIGLRKALGATRVDILRFLGWQFVRPVLVANLIAWPCAWFLMHRWLEGFAYHVDLTPLIFIASAALTIGVAMVTVSGYSISIARMKPVEALRYE
jgi:putative ABC transport system permease protein